MNTPQWILDLADMPPIHRLQHLESNADEVKDGTYYKEFDEDDLENLRIDNATTDIDIRNAEQELKDATEPIKKRLADLKAAKKDTVTKLKEKREERHGRLYTFHEGSTAYDLDADGNIIHQRTTGRRQAFLTEAQRLDGTNS